MLLVGIFIGILYSCIKYHFLNFKVQMGQKKKGKHANCLISKLNTLKRNT